MRRLAWALSGPLVATVFLATPALSRGATEVGQSRVLEFRDGIRIGTATLPAGRYTIRHVSTPDGHVLVIRLANGGCDDEGVRVPCRPAPSRIGSKIGVTAVYLDAEHDGLMRLTAVHLSGEKDRHIISDGRENHE